MLDADQVRYLSFLNPELKSRKEREAEQDQLTLQKTGVLNYRTKDDNDIYPENDGGNIPKSNSGIPSEYMSGEGCQSGGFAFLPILGSIASAAAAPLLGNAASWLWKKITGKGVYKHGSGVYKTGGRVIAKRIEDWFAMKKPEFEKFEGGLMQSPAHMWWKNIKNFAKDNIYDLSTQLTGDHKYGKYALRKVLPPSFQRFIDEQAAPVGVKSGGFSLSDIVSVPANWILKKILNTDTAKNITGKVNDVINNVSGKVKSALDIIDGMQQRYSDYVGSKKGSGMTGGGIFDFIKNGLSSVMGKVLPGLMKNGSEIASNVGTKIIGKLNSDASKKILDKVIDVGVTTAVNKVADRVMGKTKVDVEDDDEEEMDDDEEEVVKPKRKTATKPKPKPVPKKTTTTTSTPNNTGRIAGRGAKSTIKKKSLMIQVL
jgi:hypothetical protein